MEPTKYSSRLTRGATALPGVLVLMITLVATLTAGVARADVVLDFAGGGPEDADQFEITFSSGNPDTINEWDTGNNLTTWTTAGSPDGSFTAGSGITGSLAGVSGSLFWDQISSTNWSVSGAGALTVSNQVDITRNANDGWGVAGGDLEDGDLLGFDFDLSGLTLPAGFSLQITQITTSGNADTDQVIAVVDGLESTTLSPSSTNGEGSNIYDLSIDLVDGSVVAFTHDDEDFRLDTMTLSLVPEPASLALLGLGGLALIRRR